MAVLVVAYIWCALFIDNKEEPEIYAAPILANFKIETIAVLFRPVTAEAQIKRCEKPQKRERQAPCKREQIENKFGKSWVHIILAYLESAAP